jgi:hypothetical protein
MIPSASGFLVLPANRWRVIASRRAVSAEMVRTDEA